MAQRALVLSGGGVAGIAWELGMLLGIRDGSDGEVDPAGQAELVVGTSAGAAVAAQLHGAPLEELYARQLSDQHGELAVDYDRDALMAVVAQAFADRTRDLKDSLRELGDYALTADTVSEPKRRAVLEARLPSHEWPERRVLVTAVSVDGDFVVFDRNSGVDLVDAVAASCAVPGIWPPVTIDGRRYVDGGMRSTTNADLAHGADRVLALVTNPDALEKGQLGGVHRELADLAPAPTLVVAADPSSRRAFGPNALDPSVRRASAEAGRHQGRAVAAEVAAFWSAGATS